MEDYTTPRRTPIHHKHRHLGAVFGPDSGWETPLYYAVNEERSEEYDLPTHINEPNAIGVEHLGTRENVGITDIMVLAPIEIRGSSAPEFVQRAFTNDLDIDIGQIRYTILLNDDGDNLGDFTVTRMDEERYFAFTLAGNMAVEQTEWLRSNAPTDVSVTNLDNSYSNLSVWGPNADEIVPPLTDADMSRDAFPYYTSQLIEIADIPVLANRISYVGEFGWELWTLSGFESRLWEALWEIGGDYDMIPLGLDALLGMGLEKGYRLPGYDMGPENTPFEANLGFAVDMDTDFIGKTALENALDEGIDQEIACLTMDKDILPEIGESVLINGDVVGEVNRNYYGYSVQENIVTSYLPIKYADPGTDVMVEVADEQYSATVREEPLFDPDGERMRD